MPRNPSKILTSKLGRPKGFSARSRLCKCQGPFGRSREVRPSRIRDASARGLVTRLGCNSRVGSCRRPEVGFRGRQSFVPLLHFLHGSIEVCRLLRYRSIASPTPYYPVVSHQFSCRDTQVGILLEALYEEITSSLVVVRQRLGETPTDHFSKRGEGGDGHQPKRRPRGGADGRHSQ